MRAATLTAVLGIGLAAGAAAATGTITAKQLFSHVQGPSTGATRAIGFYAKGCLAGAVPLPLDGPNWQVMRLSRNRHWGTPELVSYIEKFSADVAKDGWAGLLVGDMSQPRGGPMPTGHASHQVGLDADIWLTPMPNYTLSADEREKKGAASLLIKGRLAVDQNKWSDVYARLLKRAVSYPGSGAHFRQPRDQARIVRHRRHRPRLAPQAAAVVGPRRPFPCAPGMPAGHGRLRCAAAAAAGRRLRRRPRRVVQAAAAAAEEPAEAEAAAPELTLADLPKACTDVVNDGQPADAAETAAMPSPRVRPATN